MPDTIKISELDEALAIADAAEFPYTQENGGELTTFKAPLTQIAAKVVEDMSYAGINLPAGAGVKSVENTLNYLLGAVGNPNENIAPEYDPTATYAKGDYVIYENVLYICTDSNGTTGTFDPAAWSQTELAQHTAENAENIGDLSDLTTSDKSSVVDAINEIATYTPVYGNTASGAIATFDTSLALPLQNCVIAINAVQEGSGTPSPSNIRNIVGFTGANIRVVGSNLFDEVMELGSINNSTGQNETASNVLRSTNYIQIAPNTTYKFTLGSYVYAFYYYDVSKTFISFESGSSTFTTPANACYVRFRMYSAYGTTYNNNIAILYPSSLNSYVAYNANSTTTAISWQTEAGTVYGGSLDVKSGVLTVDWFGVKPTDLTLNGYSAGSLTVCYRVNLVNNAILASLTSDKRGAKSNMSTENTAYYGVMRPNECDVNCFAITQDGTKVSIYDTDTTLTQAQFETKYSDMFIIYPLATPLTYQLTPKQITAIVGTNNIFTDTNGNTSVMYACSLKDYIDMQ